MKTAIEWLAEQITTVKWKMSDVTDRNSIIEQAKTMEREQIIKAASWTSEDGLSVLSELAEQYYNETFKSDSHD